MVFKYLEEVNLKIKLSKCQCFKQHLHYLVHLISKQGIQLLLEKVKAIEKFKEPNNINGLHHFRGLTGYYQKITLLSADIIKSLNKLLKKDSTFQCLSQCQTAFECLKKVICKEPILQYLNTDMSYTVFTDASHYVCSRVLTQAVDSPEDMGPI